MPPNYQKGLGTESDKVINGKDNSGVGFRPKDTSAEVVFCAFAAFSIGLNVLVMGISSFCMIFGQDLAYRGVQGSMSKAVDGLYVERKFALRLYYMAVTSMICSAVSLTWLMTESEGRRYGFIAIFLLTSIITVVYMRTRVRPHFKFPKEYKRRPSIVKLFGASLDPEMQLGQSFDDNDELRGGSSPSDVISAINYVIKSPLLPSDLEDIDENGA